MKPVTKITLHSSEEIELTEREQEIYRAGYKKGDDDGFYKMLLILGFITVVISILSLF